MTGNSYDLEFIVEEEVIEEEKKEKEEIKDLDLNFNSNLNPRYTFANFVIGESNRFAQTAAVAVAEQPGIYIPFIYSR